jgi:AcrR family transcriptional regulator
MVANRGYNSTSTLSRLNLIKAAGELLEHEGAHAISARRVADRAGLKPQLVHYYFRTMEDLLIAVFEYATEQYFELHELAIRSTTPLRALWELNSNVPNVRRNMAFIALGAVHPNLRNHMRDSGERFRALQLREIEKIFDRVGIDKNEFPPASVAMLMSAVARTLAMEGPIGVETGHRELRQVIERFIDRVEGPRAPAAGDAIEQQSPAQ